MNSQIATALLIVAGAGISTVALFSIIHNSFRSALMPNATASGNADDTGRYFGKIY